MAKTNSNHSQPLLNTSYSKNEIGKCLAAKYDDEIMNEMINDPRFQDDQTTKHIKKLNRFQLKLYKGRLVVLGAYDTYLQNRELLKNDRREL